MKKIFTLIFLLLLSSAAYADKLTKVSSDSLDFSLESNGNDYKLYISPKSELNDKSLTANVFPVKNPSRLVIDIPDFAAGGQKNVTLNDAHISGLRLGVHNNKIRLVIDIKDSTVPDYDISADEDSGRLIASFSFDSEKQEIIATPKPTPIPDIFAPEPTARPTPKPTAQPIIKPTIETTIKATPTEDIFKESGTISIKPTPEKFVMRGNEEVNPENIKPPTNTKNTNTASTVINNILFQAPKDAPLGAIVIEGEKIGEYMIEQKGKNMYELNIKNSKLAGEQLSLPQFPPASFKGFEVILANQEGSDVILKIYVNDEIKIKPSNSKGKLWLKAEK